LFEITKIKYFFLHIYREKIMAKARKEGKKKRSRKSVVKTLKIISKNEELIRKYNLELKNS